MHFIASCLVLEPFDFKHEEGGYLCLVLSSHFVTNTHHPGPELGHIHIFMGQTLLDFLAYKRLDTGLTLARSHPVPELWQIHIFMVLLVYSQARLRFDLDTYVVGAKNILINTFLLLYLSCLV